LKVKSVVRSNDNIEVKSSRLSKNFCISLKQLVAVLLLVIIIVGMVFWAVQRINAHKRWASMLRESQRLRSHLDRVAYLLPAKFQTGSVSQNWVIAELSYASSSLSELIRLDGEHEVPLRKIDHMIMTLRDPDVDLSGSNSTEQLDLMETIHNVGWKVVKAYGNLLNYTSVGEDGPSFWYFGPAPPDEVVLEEAAQLATNVTTKVG
jgi:hypothetical protein